MFQATSAEMSEWLAKRQPPLVKCSGDSQIAATADLSLFFAPAGRVLVTDGLGNVVDSGVPLASIGLLSTIDGGTF